ncbi:hypothetical protein BST81_12285 [Leptolyngbya sp. 'hensonii']|uniref:tetratricopeptide repeat protein n=1 Tax=Leptolyngbya sp. 'hensonii' TaxID=1922337 RepID=UPI00094F51FF|nr:tetratricopeptide repeat protein [Leptolyngbya sp. 'hensonii']OLP17837.1 hypothetical protein BST81_12285 [Leptolyngbya sp. 'hensonii']
MSVIDTVVSAENLLKEGDVRAEQGDYIGAVAAYTQALRLNPDYAKAYGNRGLVHTHIGERRSAIQDYRKAAELFIAQGSIANYQMMMGLLRREEQQ